MTDHRHLLGRRAEEAAARYLEAHGYRVLARNWRTVEGELDIVAERDGVLAFVEVRARRGQAMGTAAESITPRKRRRLLRAALAYLQETGATLEPRLDVILLQLTPGGRILSLEHLPGAVEE